MQLHLLPLTLLLLTYRWFVPLRGPPTRSSPLFISSSSFSPSPHLMFSFQSPLTPSFNSTFLLRTPLFALCLLFSSVFFTPSLLPVLPPFSRSLPAMQTLKVNLHSKVLLLASAAMTEQFSPVPLLFSFLFPFLFYFILLFT